MGLVIGDGQGENVLGAAFVASCGGPTERPKQRFGRCVSAASCVLWSRSRRPRRLSRSNRAALGLGRRPRGSRAHSCATLRATLSFCTCSQYSVVVSTVSDGAGGETEWESWAARKRFRRQRSFGSEHQVLLSFSLTRPSDTAQRHNRALTKALRATEATTRDRCAFE